MTRESIVFYRSFYESIQQIPDAATREKVYKAIFEYGLNGNEIELNGIEGALFTAFKPQLDANNKRYKNGLKGAEFGKLGGRPKKPQENPKGVTDKNPEKTPNVNVNDNENVNVNEKIKEKPQKKNYGEHANVKLTDEEHERLNNDYGIDLTIKAIAFLDSYIEEKGYKSKSHNLALRRWVFDAVKEREQKQSKLQPKNSFNSFSNQNHYTAAEMSELEKQLVDNLGG